MGSGLNLFTFFLLATKLKLLRVLLLARRPYFNEKVNKFKPDPFHG